MEKIGGSELMAITTKVEGDKLIIEVDIAERDINEAKLSKTGKSKVVATTGGWRKVADGSTISFSLNVIHVDRL
jgi:hypothetical protein